MVYKVRAVSRKRLEAASAVAGVYVQERYDTRELSRLGGLLTQAPYLGWILGFCAMASLGLPGLAGPDVE